MDTISQRENQLAFGLGTSAWSKLRQDLLDGHRTDNPVSHALNVINGWIPAFGPAFATCRSDLADQILSIGMVLGYRELNSRDHLIHQMDHAWNHWQDSYLQDDYQSQPDMEQPFQLMEKNEMVLSPAPPG